MSKRGWIAVWVLWLALCGYGSARAEALDDREVYDHLVDAAVEQFARGNWEEARALFERAQTVYPNARALRGLGMADFNLHAYARATAELEAALGTQAQPLDLELRAQVDSLLGRAQPFVARMQLKLSPEHALLYVDDEPALLDAQRRLLLDLGIHTVRLESPAHQTVEQRLLVRSGGESELSLTAPAIEGPAPPPPERRGLRIARRIALGAGLALLGGGLAAQLRSNARFDDLGAYCRARAGCLEDEVDLTAVHRLDRIAVPSMTIGSALVLSAFAIWLFDPSVLGGRK